MEVQKSSSADIGISDISIGHVILESQKISYALFPHFCQVQDVLHAMVHEWELDFPKIMLLIISDKSPLKTWQRQKQQDKFIKGLVKGSNATSMWIFTSGLNIGIAKAIGDAVEDDFNKRQNQICYRHTEKPKRIIKTPLIGVCEDQILTYSDQFKNPGKKINLFNKGNNPEEQKFNLNPYHSHFLITQNDSARKDGTNRFLLQLVDAFRLAKKPTSDSETVLFPPHPVPIIAILIQGNIHSIHYILAHLKRKLPLIVIRGSGGLADVLAYVVHEVRRSVQKIKDTDYVETVLRRGLNDKIISVFPALKDNKMSQNLLCGRILECIDCCDPPELNLITVLNVTDLTCDMEDLSLYLLQVIFQSGKSESLSLHMQLKKDLQLTIDWNLPEIALTKVFYKDITFQVDNDMFEQALLGDGREEFVSLFLDNKFAIHKYLSASTLIRLYKHSLEGNFFRQVCWEGILGHEKVTTLDESFIVYELNWIIENLSGIPRLMDVQELNKNSKEIFDKNNTRNISIDIATRRAMIALVIWALLSNHSALAIFLCRHMDQPIMCALSASLMLDNMIVHINENKLKEEISELSKKFAEIAVGIFDLCYNDMPSKAYDVLNVRLDEWGRQSVIDMASLSQNRTFVAHSCCQKWLTNKFMGNVKIRDLPLGFMTFPVYIKVILCAFFLFPMYIWVRFKEHSIHEFVGDEDFDDDDPYYLPQEGDKLKTPKEESGRSHLLKYRYPPLWQMIFWMWSAPITKFWVSNIFYILYLIVFSVAVIWPSCGNALLDSIICLWTCSIAVDSIYLLYSKRQAYPNTALFEPCLEIIYMITYVIFFYLIRLSGIFAFQYPYSGKILICIGLLYFYYRMIVIYLPISSTLGPLLYRVKRMITVDFINFMKLVVFILIGNGIVMQAILYPDFPLIPELIRKSFHKTFFMFFMTPVGELTSSEPNCFKFAQKPESETMCRVSDYVDGKCSSGVAFWPYVIVFQYVLLLKLILMTVLTALYAVTGAKVAAEADSIWKFQRYKLIVNFSNSLRLPPPLNIFSVVIILYKFIIRCCKCDLFSFKKIQYDEKLKQIVGGTDVESTKYLSSAEYSYWRQLARDYFAEKEQEKKEKEYTKNELDIISQLSEDLSMKEAVIFRAQAQITQLQADICYTHAHLETLKYRAKEKEASVKTLHSLSRESPYPRTKIKRYPVPDKYVPWEVMWLHYEPENYSLPKSEFFPELQPYVDDADLTKTEKENKGEEDMASYVWNLESVDAQGVYRNRKSWITNAKNQPITYRLDISGYPRNPMGRTGLCGKGALPRWGPNHHAYVIITRWKRKKGTTSSLEEEGKLLEYVETWYMKKKDLSLPGGFVWSENKYQVIQDCFKMEENSEPWESHEDMIQFLRKQTVGLEEEEQPEEKFESKKVLCGYMDDTMNTDQAWKEVELWHVHYNIVTSLYKKFKNKTRWRLLSEDVFTQLPYGQTVLLQDAIRPLNAKIAHA